MQESEAVKPMTLNEALAETIRVELARKRVKQRVLCEALHLSHGQVSQRLADEIDLIALTLNMPVVDLVSRADDARRWANLVERGQMTETEFYAGRVGGGSTPGEIRTLLPRLDSNQQPCVIPSLQVSTDVVPAAEHLATVTPLHPRHAARLTPRGPIIQPNPSNPTRPAHVGASTGVSAAVPPGAAADAQSPVTHLDDYRARRHGEATGRTA